MQGQNHEMSSSKFEAPLPPEQEGFNILLLEWDNNLGENMKIMLSIHVGAAKLQKIQIFFLGCTSSPELLEVE